MWQKALQLSGGGGNTESVEGSFKVSSHGHKEINIFSNNIGMINFFSPDNYYANWKLEGTTFSKINGNASSNPFTFSDNKMIINSKSSTELTFTYVIAKAL